MEALRIVVMKGWSVDVQFSHKYRLSFAVVVLIRCVAVVSCIVTVNRFCLDSPDFSQNNKNSYFPVYRALLGLLLLFFLLEDTSLLICEFSSTRTGFSVFIGVK